MQTLLTVTPIFVLIILGFIAARIKLLPEDAQGPLNRLVYYFAIPAFLFNAVSNFPLAKGFNAKLLIATLGAAFTFYLLGWILCKLGKVSFTKAGVFVQGSCHGNLGYIGLPVAFYFLGEAGLAKAGIIAGFLMILQNIMSVTILQSFTAEQGGRKKFAVVFKLMQNPVIISCMLGIIASGLELPIPDVVNRTLKMLGQLAPPAALLLIGASMSFEKLKTQFLPILGVVTTKLVLLPCYGLLLISLLKLEISESLPAIILLGTPTATVAYVLARQMKADAEMAVAIISTSTLLSVVTLPILLSYLIHGY